jgi:hypothetical protein
MPGEHYDGVGPLPGSISETSVAKLPDERFASSGEPDRPVRQPPARPAAVSLPSQERKGVQPYEHHDGVGPLPGSSSETSVAKLPEERKQERLAAAAAGPASGSQESASRAAAGIVNLGTQVRRVDPQQDAASAQKVPERGDQEAADVQVSDFSVSANPSRVFSKDACLGGHSRLEIQRAGGGRREKERSREEGRAQGGTTHGSGSQDRGGREGGAGTSVAARTCRRPRATESKVEQRL